MEESRIPKAIRYIISGGTGAAVNLGSLFTLTHFFGVWYLFSSVVAFLASFLVSFMLQRAWTFDIRSRTGIMRHGSLYFLAALGNLALNTVLIYLFVEYVRLWYVFAQLVSGVIIAAISFFIYRRIFVPL